MTDLITILVGVFLLPILLLLIVAIALGRAPHFSRFSLPRLTARSSDSGDNLGVVLAVVAIALAVLVIAENRPGLGEGGAATLAVLALVAVVALRFAARPARFAISLAGIAISMWAIWVAHGPTTALAVGVLVLLLLWFLGALRPLG